MTNPRPWFAATTTLLVGLLTVVPTIAGAASMPVKIEGFEGEVVQVSGAIHSGVTPGKALQPGTQLKTGPDGRADVSLDGAPTLRLGNGVDLLLHSMDQDVLRLRSASGAIFVDTRTPVKTGGASRDVRLNAGDLRLRIADAEAWIEVDDGTGQVCVMAGVVEVQQPNAGSVRLDTPGQCLRQSGRSSQWTMVPTDLLQARIAATGVQRAVAAAPAPPTPKPVLQIKVLPLPGTMPDSDRPKEPIVVLQQAPPTSSLNVKVPEPVDVPEVPAAPEPLPVAPAAASTVALELPEPVEVPVVPDPPEPLPVAPAPAQTVAMKSVEPVEVPVVPDPPEPLPVAPAPATAVAMTLAEPVAVPEVPDAPAPAEPVAEAVATPVPGKPRPVPLPPEPPASAPAASEPVAAEPAPAAPAAPIEEAPPAIAVASASTEVALASPASTSSAPAPAADDGRRWRVVLGSMQEREKAELEAERLNARGWAVEAREYRVGERRGFRIGFGEFVERQDAQKALEEFLVQYPDAPAWLAKY